LGLTDHEHMMNKNEHSATGRIWSCRHDLPRLPNHATGN
jgi:hypothetical protein